MDLTETKHNIFNIAGVIRSYPNIGKYNGLREVGMWEFLMKLESMWACLSRYQENEQKNIIELKTALSILKNVIEVLKNDLKEFPTTIESLALERIRAELRSNEVELQKLYLENNRQ